MGARPDGGRRGYAGGAGGGHHVAPPGRPVGPAGRTHIAVSREHELTQGLPHANPYSRAGLSTNTAWRAAASGRNRDKNAIRSVFGGPPPSLLLWVLGPAGPNKHRSGAAA